MFSNLLRQQARLALSTRLTVPLRQQSKKSVLALSTQTSRILSQRTFSISRSLFEEAPANSYSQTGRASVATQGGRASLYVGNLPYSVEEGELRELFEPYGTVERVSLGGCFCCTLRLSLTYPTHSKSSSTFPREVSLGTSQERLRQFQRS